MFRFVVAVTVLYKKILQFYFFKIIISLLGLNQTRYRTALKCLTNILCIFCRFSYTCLNIVYLFYSQASQFFRSHDGASSRAVSECPPGFFRNFTFIQIVQITRYKPVWPTNSYCQITQPDTLQVNRCNQWFINLPSNRQQERIATLEEIYWKRPALFYVVLFSSRSPFCHYGHHPNLSRSLSSLCVGGKGLLTPAGRRRGWNQLKGQHKT